MSALSVFPPMSTNELESKMSNQGDLLYKEPREIALCEATMVFNGSLMIVSRDKAWCCTLTLVSFSFCDACGSIGYEVQSFK